MEWIAKIPPVVAIARSIAWPGIWPRVVAYASVDVTDEEARDILRNAAIEGGPFLHRDCVRACRSPRDHSYCGLLERIEGRFLIDMYDRLPLAIHRTAAIVSRVAYNRDPEGCAAREAEGDLIDFLNEVVASWTGSWQDFVDYCAHWACCLAIDGFPDTRRSHDRAMDAIYAIRGCDRELHGRICDVVGRPDRYWTPDQLESSLVFHVEAWTRRHGRLDFACSDPEAAARISSVIGRQESILTSSDRPALRLASMLSAFATEVPSCGDPDEASVAAAIRRHKVGPKITDCLDQGSRVRDASPVQ